MKTIEGDLLTIERGVILHQTNCFGVTGGLAGALWRKWPHAFDWYADQCKTYGAGMLGDCLPGCASSKLMIYHVFGQLRPGPNTDMEAAGKALAESAVMYRAAESRYRPVYAPWKMGCGLGGGDWTAYSALLEKHLPDLIIVRKPGYDR